MYIQLSLDDFDTEENLKRDDSQASFEVSFYFEGMYGCELAIYIEGFILRKFNHTERYIVFHVCVLRFD